MNNCPGNPLAAEAERSRYWSKGAIINAGSMQNLDYLYIIFNELDIPCYLIFDGNKPIAFDPTQVDPAQKNDLESKSR